MVFEKRVPFNISISRYELVVFFKTIFTESFSFFNSEAACLFSGSSFKTSKKSETNRLETLRDEI